MRPKKERKPYMKKPHKLLDCLIDFYKFKNDAAIAHLLNTTPPVISRIRNGFVPVSSTLILAVYDATKMPIEKIRELLNA